MTNEETTQKTRDYIVGDTVIEVSAARWPDGVARLVTEQIFTHPDRTGGDASGGK